MKTNKGYVFLSHSSKDILKVRKIRNVIEDEGGNPILFYLKCLDNDSPESDDEQMLKSLISREIKARKKFILCESSNTEYGKSKYIDWEIEEVRKLQAQNSNMIQVESINIDADDESIYLCKVEEFVFKQDKIIIVAAYEDAEASSIVLKYLQRLNFNVECAVESGDVRDDMRWHGDKARGYIDAMIDHILSANKGIVVPMISTKSNNNTYMQMALCKLSRKSFIIGFDVTDGVNDMALEELRNTIMKYINS